MPRLSEFEGRGIWYWASAIEAKHCAQQEVALVGGGNSAGQAAVFSRAHAAKVNVLVRGPSLAASMSRYLIDRIEATPNIELHPHTQLVRLNGDAPRRPDRRHVALRGYGRRARLRGSQHLPVRRRRTRDQLARRLRRFCRQAWLRTDRRCGEQRLCRHSPPQPSNPACKASFAVGDVRSGSVKRVGGAIGEGAAVVALIHQHLSSSSAVACRPLRRSRAGGAIPGPARI
jgi:thioredoxin reductase (NADPH)